MDLKSETGFCKLVFQHARSLKMNQTFDLELQLDVTYSKYILDALFCYSFFVCLAQNKFSGVVWVQLTACSVFGFDFFQDWQDISAAKAVCTQNLSTRYNLRSRFYWME